MRALKSTLHRWLGAVEVGGAVPYLVQTYSLFGRAAVAWFEMELVEGPNLPEELDRFRGSARASR